jgi:HAD superfamily phosphoserine phosphatase-like hydrolase
MTAHATLQKLFNCTVLVLAVFFPIHYAVQSTMTTIHPKTFILDFDGTITTKDTISILANSAISFHAKNGKDMAAVWNRVVKAYRNDYEEFGMGYRPVKEDRRTVDEEVIFYRRLRGVEERSFGRVGKEAIFKGIQQNELEKFGEQVVRSGAVSLRRGFTDFVKEMKKEGGRWDIVSVSFSRAFIRGILGTIGSEVKDVKVLANEPDESGILRGPKSENGELWEAMATSDAKLSAMKYLLRSLDAESRRRGAVYIGDSGTDMECLMEESVVGIIISEDGNSDLMQIMKRINVEVLHIDEYQEKKTKGLYWARDFIETVRSPLFR